MQPVMKRACVALLGILAAGFSILTMQSVTWVERGLRRIPILPQWLRPAFGGILVAALALALAVSPALAQKKGGDMIVGVTSPPPLTDDEEEDVPDLPPQGRVLPAPTRQMPGGSRHCWNSCARRPGLPSAGPWPSWSMRSAATWCANWRR
mgnify:CR=1 FL=1